MSNLQRIALLLVVGLLVPVAVAETFVPILSENFQSNPAAWTYSGRQNASGQNLFRWNSAGKIDAEWDESNFIDAFDSNWNQRDPYVIQPSSFSRPLGRTMTDNDTFRFRVKLNLDGVANTKEFYEVANFGLYNLSQTGPDRSMCDNWSGNTTLVKDACDFIEFNYFIQNESYGWNPMTQTTIGAHIAGLDGDYITGDKNDSLFHQTDMGANNYLPTGTDLYVQVTYYGLTTRRAYSGVYTDAVCTQRLSVAGVEQYYWTQAVPSSKHFSVTDAAFWNYAAVVFDGPNATGSGSFDDFQASLLATDGDASLDGRVNVIDLGLLASNYGTTSGATWQMADFNGDGRVNVIDLGMLASNYEGAETSSVPEPISALVLLGGGAIAACRRQG
jgi:hypothetical protein